MKYIASVSFGKDSLGMLLRLLEEKYPLDIVLFYDTHMEFDAIYRIRDKVKLILQKRGIEYVELQPEEPFLFSMFERKVKNRNKPGYHYGYSWCGGRCRWGTTAKLRAIQQYKKSLGGDVVDYVGIAADEISRFEKAKSDGKTLPLVDWGMTEADCLRYCRERGWNWIEQTPRMTSGVIDLYDILDRVSCWCCANKNLKELYNIWYFLPLYWGMLENLQSRTLLPMKKCCNKEFGDYGNIFKMKKVFEIKEKKGRRENGK